MNLLQLLQTRSKAFYFILILVSLICCLTNMGILFVINTLLKTGTQVLFGRYNYLLFFGLILVSFSATIVLQNNVARLTYDLMFEMELSIIEKLRNASYDSFLQLGKEKVYTAIADAETIGRLPEFLLLSINSSVSILCSLFFLLYTSPAGGITIFILFLILLGVFLHRNKTVSRYLNESRTVQNRYYFFLNELMSGFRQIKISQRRNDNLFNDHLLRNRKIVRELNIRSSKMYISNQLYGVYCWYILIGVIVFVLPSLLRLNVAETVSFITAILFMMSPMGGLISVLPFFTRMKIALERMGEVDRLLRTDRTSRPFQESCGEFESIEFRDLFYSYNTGKTGEFSVNIQNLTIGRSEIIFLVGGNGSGKTTFINLLTGLYKPLSGRVFINGKEVDWEEFGVFSNNMAVVYTDHHLFSENYDGHDFSEANSRLRHWKESINVKGILNIDQEKNRLNIGFSKGQQKRLALMLALLEDKPIIVLDEWAAEQDPSNRRDFYEKWLGRIREMGKTIIVISHDDDSFNQADRIIKFDFGRIVSDEILII